MNYRMIINMLGKILLAYAGLMLPALAVSLIYAQGDAAAFVLSIAVTSAAGGCLLFVRPRKRDIYAREGFALVALAWILMGIFGALPFIFSGSLTSPIDAVFETVSGLTTTGASTVRDVEALPMGIGFWRCFIIFIGGMGVLVFLLAIMPLAKERSMHIMRAEVPGPSVGKLVSKTKDTAIILYSIYIGLTLLQTLLLMAGGMPAYDAITTAFSVAGTGGFGIKNASMGAYNDYCQTVCTVFMLLFAVNFNLYYFILIRKFALAAKNEELRWFVLIYVAGVAMIVLNIMHLYDSFAKALHDAAFQAASIYSTTGLSNMNFDEWPTFSKSVLLMLMMFGGCAGSTAGGIKTSRTIILFKSMIHEIRRLIHPRSVSAIRLEGRPVDDSIIKGTQIYMSTLIGIIAVSIMLVSIEGRDFMTCFSGVWACIFNVGPGFNIVGPARCYADLSALSKSVLTLDMLIGRLEIWPLLTVFAPGTWKRRYR